MRKIKFRAWLKNTEEMIEVNDIQFRDDNEYIIDGIKFKPRKEQPIIINTKGAWRTEDEIELMIYICLNDRNGKEIYESDIVKGVDKLTGAEINGVVTFKDGSFCIYDKEKEIYHFRWMDYDVEVIGNIYENS